MKEKASVIKAFLHKDEQPYDGSISRRLNHIYDGLQANYQKMISREELLSTINALELYKGKSNEGSILSTLYMMLKKANINYIEGKDVEYYHSLVTSANLLSSNDLADYMLSELYKNHKEYMSPSDYMLRLVNDLSDPNDHWQSDTLRLRILKQFIKYGYFLTYEDLESNKTIYIYNGKNYIIKYVKNNIKMKSFCNRTSYTSNKTLSIDDILDNIDDAIFDVVGEATKEQLAPDGTYGLIKLSNDLAEGHFRTGGNTKKALYMFAMVYNMRYYGGSRIDEENLSRNDDIENRLFREYYANNFMRFVNYDMDDLCKIDLDPSGQGINFKNFQEVIYLYYISQDCSVLKKLRGSHEMINDIERIRDEFHVPKGNAERIECAFSRTTIHYRRLANKSRHTSSIYSEDIMQLNQVDFEDFICDNYTLETNNIMSPLQLEQDQNSAFEMYELLLAMIKYLSKDYANTNPLEECDHGLWFSDIENIKNMDIDSLKKKLHVEDIDTNKWNGFVKVLTQIDDFMVSQISKKVTPSNVSRTAIIIAYYYYYTQFHSEDKSIGVSMTFEEMFNDFREYVNWYLYNAYYQPFSGKNIFDIIIAFSAYARINDIEDSVNSDIRV